jgi:hypothetical protein
MIAALRQNLFSPPRHDGFSLIRVMFGPFIVLSLLMLPWAHSSGTWLPTVLVWVCFTLSGCAEKLPRQWIVPAVILRISTIVGLLIAFVWLIIAY